VNGSSIGAVISTPQKHWVALFEPEASAPSSGSPELCNLSWHQVFPGQASYYQPKRRARIFVGGADSTTRNTLSRKAHYLKTIHLIRLLLLYTGTYWPPLLLPLWFRSQLHVNFHCRCSLRCRPSTKSNIPDMSLCHIWQNERLKVLLTCSNEAKADNARPDKSL
jgi:hypothetical protein